MDSDLLYVGTYTTRPVPPASTSSAWSVARETGACRLSRVRSESIVPRDSSERPGLYAVNEVGTYNGMKTGAVSAFEIARAQARSLGATSTV